MKKHSSDDSNKQLTSARPSSSTVYTWPLLSSETISSLVNKCDLRDYSKTLSWCALVTLEKILSHIFRAGEEMNTVKLQKTIRNKDPPLTKPGQAPPENGIYHHEMEQAAGICGDCSKEQVR